MKPTQVKFKVPPTKTLPIRSLKGVDLYNQQTNVDITRSPDAINMIRDEVGKVRKRTGYHLIKDFEDSNPINGRHFYKENVFTHIGEKLYKDDELIYSEMNNRRSFAWNMASRLYIFDGKEYLVYGEFDSNYQLKKVSDVAYIPKIIIGRSPANGGGTTLEPINLIQSKWTEGFLGATTDKTYKLSFGNLDSTLVTAKRLNSDGTWTDLAETTNFSVNRTTGVLTFTTAPVTYVPTGKDNVEITASRVIEGYKDKINKCDISIQFGVNGAADRIFVAGNPDFPNYDWYSQMNDPTYFGDLWYSVLGSDNAPILGYTITSDRLCAHKKSGDDGRNVIMRTGTLYDNVAAFPIVSTLQGVGAIGKYSFAYLQNEPLFLTELGIYAITPADITGERYTQNRSFYINRQLQEEPNLENAIGFTYKDFYMLAVNGKVYIMDGLQKTRDRNAPQSEFLYECYLWTNLNIYSMWNENGELYFGTEDGKIFAFYTDTEAQLSYNDNGAAIPAYWTLPDISGEQFYKNKTFKRIAVLIAPAAATGVKIYSQVKGVWDLIYSSEGEARFFSWDDLDWDKLSWDSDPTPRTLSSRIKIKKVDKASFRFENSEFNEPFGIYQINIEFSDGGNYKG